jgi:hypothetical protein
MNWWKVWQKLSNSRLAECFSMIKGVSRLYNHALSGSICAL